jgi:translocation and assembly module TamA
MRPPAHVVALAVLLLCLPVASPAEADKLTAVAIRGLDDPLMLDNVRRALSLVESIGRDLSDARRDYLVRQAEPEARHALEPFGYFSPTVDVAAGADGTITVTIAPGEAVHVDALHVAVTGPGEADAVLKADVDAFLPRSGAVFDQALYETSKSRIARSLADRGYFDASLDRHDVQVTRATRAADIDLAWSSGARHVLGPVSFVQSPKAIVNDALLAKQVHWKPGAPFDQAKLDALRDTLSRLDYFAGIDIEPQLVDADGKAVGLAVPITVTLTPAKRSVYTAGLSVGSTSGPGIRLGLERRYLNKRGHKALAELEWARQRKLLSLEYRIPASAWFEGWYALGVQAADEQTDYIDSRRVELVASRSGEINAHWRALVGLHLLRERWAYAAEDDGDPLTPPDYRYASLLFPSVSGTYRNVDNLLEPRRGIAGSAELRGGIGGAGSDANFVQTRVEVKWFHGLGPNDRLLLRGEVGHTFTNALLELPPSLRFHAGGDGSIRGYAWREVGPRVGVAGKRFPIGASNVVTASAEYERYFTARWGAAAFVDTGSAFEGHPELRTGVGVGLRWRSPVGPLRVDIARGLDQPDSPFQITLNIGANL